MTPPDDAVIAFQAWRRCVYAYEATVVAQLSMTIEALRESFKINDADDGSLRQWLTALNAGTALAGIKDFGLGVYEHQRGGTSWSACWLIDQSINAENGGWALMAVMSPHLPDKIRVEKRCATSNCINPRHAVVVENAVAEPSSNDAAKLGPFCNDCRKLVGRYVVLPQADTLQQQLDESIRKNGTVETACELLRRVYKLAGFVAYQDGTQQTDIQWMTGREREQ